MAVVDEWTGFHVRCLREAARYTQRDLAEHLGVALRTVGEWESRGQARIGSKNAQSLLDAACGRLHGDARDRFRELVSKQPNRVGMALTGFRESRYVVPDAVAVVRDFACAVDSASILVVTGEAGVGKSRLAVYLQEVLTDVADVQWHVSSGLAWSTGRVDEVALEIVRLAGVDLASDSDPVVALRDMASRRPLVIVVDGVNELDQVAGVVDTLVRHGAGMLRWVLTVRTPPALHLGKWPMLAAVTRTVELGPWSVAVARREWDRGSFSAFDELSASVQELARIPLFHNLLTADERPGVEYTSTFDLIGRTVAAVTDRGIDHGLIRLALLQLKGAIPPSLQSPDEQGEVVRESAIVQRLDDGQLAFAHDVFAEHVAAVHIVDQLQQWGRTARAVELVNELATASVISAAARGLFVQVVQGLHRRGLLNGIVQSPLVDADAALPLILSEVSSDEVVRMCTARARASSSVPLARAALAVPNLTTAIGSEWTQWWAKAVEMDHQTWQSARWAAEHTLTAVEARRLLDTLDTSNLAVATWTAGALTVLTGERHPAAEALATHPHWQVRAAMITTLLSAEGGPDGWAESITAGLLNDADYKVRAAAASQARGDYLRQHLDVLLRDESWHVRARAVQSVLLQGGPELLKDAVVAVTADPTWNDAPTESRALMERLLMGHDPEQYAAAYPATTWRLLREERIDAQLPAETVRILRRAASNALSWVHRREANTISAAPVGPVQAPASADAWRRLRGQRHLQVALDQPGLERAVRVAQAVVAAGCPIVEVGDPLIKAHGSVAISRIKEAVPNATVVAEMMSADWGRDQVETAAAAGADAVLLIGPASPASVSEAARAARRYGTPIVLDVPVTATMHWIRDIETAGVDGLSVTSNIDLGTATGDPIARARWLRDITRLPVSVSGGFSAEVQPAPDWDVLIVGRAVADAVDPGRATSAFLSAIEIQERRLP